MCRRIRARRRAAFRTPKGEFRVAEALVQNDLIAVCGGKGRDPADSAVSAKTILKGRDSPEICFVFFQIKHPQARLPRGGTEGERLKIIRFRDLKQIASCTFAGLPGECHSAGDRYLRIVLRAFRCRSRDRNAKIRSVLIHIQSCL